MTLLPRFAAVAALLLSATVAHADALVDALRAEAAKTPVVAFERTTKVEQFSGKGPGYTVRVDRFNPRSSSWTLVSMDGRAPTPDQISKHREEVNALPIPGFHRLDEVLAGEPRRVTDAKGRQIYRWDSLKPGSFPTTGPDMSKSVAAEAFIEEIAGRPVIRELRIFAPAPFAVMTVAKVKGLNLISQYRNGTAGPPFMFAQASETDVTAPLGLGGKRKTLISYKPL